MTPLDFQLKDIKTSSIIARQKGKEGSTADSSICPSKDSTHDDTSLPYAPTSHAKSAAVEPIIMSNGPEASALIQYRQSVQHSTKTQRAIRYPTLFGHLYAPTPTVLPIQLSIGGSTWSCLASRETYTDVCNNLRDPNCHQDWTGPGASTRLYIRMLSAESDHAGYVLPEVVETMIEGVKSDSSSFGPAFWGRDQYSQA